MKNFRAGAQNLAPCVRESSRRTLRSWRHLDSSVANSFQNIRKNFEFFFRRSKIIKKKIPTQDFSELGAVCEGVLEPHTEAGGIQFFSEYLKKYRFSFFNGKKCQFSFFQKQNSLELVAVSQRVLQPDN